MTEWKVGDRIQLTGTVRTASGLAMEVGFECKGRERCVWFSVSELAQAVRLDAAPAAEPPAEKPIIPREGEWWVARGYLVHRLRRGVVQFWGEEGWEDSEAQPGLGVWAFGETWRAPKYPTAVVVGPEGQPVARQIVTEGPPLPIKRAVLVCDDDWEQFVAVLFPGFDLEANLRYQREREQGK